MRFEFISGVGVFQTRWDFEVDSKAMRKVSANETIVTMAQSQQGAFDISASLRTLVKLT